MTQIIQLEGLEKLFEASMPAAQRLAPEAARIAFMMFKAGRDAAAIAQRTGAPLAAVLAFLDKAAPPKSTLPPSREDDKEQGAAPAAEPAATSPTPPAPAQEPPPEPRDPRPDIELTRLQQAAIRQLRKLGIPAREIGTVMRVSPNQVARICKEIP
jgi:hypothetical protein